jgi:hypothetical protein
MTHDEAAAKVAEIKAANDAAREAAIKKIADDTAAANIAADAIWGAG